MVPGQCKGATYILESMFTSAFQKEAILFLVMHACAMVKSLTVLCVQIDTCTAIFDDLATYLQKADAFVLTNQIALAWQSYTQHVI